MRRQGHHEARHAREGLAADAPQWRDKAMIPAAFDYVVPRTLPEAVAELVKRGQEAKVLAGGHSPIPPMKLRLATPPLPGGIGPDNNPHHHPEEGGHLANRAPPTPHHHEVLPPPQKK